MENNNLDYESSSEDYTSDEELGYKPIKKIKKQIIVQTENKPKELNNEPKKIIINKKLLLLKR